MKGIILAGGSGSRLYPITKGISKQLLPIYDKPMIYYPISALIQSGIKEILIISTPHDISGYKKLLGSGKDLGLKFSYIIQPSPDGLAQAFILGKEFIGKDSVCLVLGDNIFHGLGFKKLLLNAKKNVELDKKATIFGYRVNDPERYGIAEINEKGSVISLEEKPKKPKSNYAVIGIYFYPNSVIDLAEKLKPSKRGELEITSLNEKYLEKKELKIQLMERGFAWLDTGTHDSLVEAGEFVKVLEKRTGLKIGCIEENSFEEGFISIKQLKKLGKDLCNTNYGKYILKRVENWK